MKTKTYYSKEKQIIVSMISSLLILVIYSLYVYSKYIKSNLAILDDFRFWGKAFFVLIAVSIVAQIVIHILFAIINKILTNEDMPSITDERDKLIELKSIRISHWVFILGFLSSMAALAFGLRPWTMFVILIASGFISGVVEGIAQIYYYRKGV